MRQQDEMSQQQSTRQQTSNKQQATNTNNQQPTTTTNNQQPATTIIIPTSWYQLHDGSRSIIALVPCEAGQRAEGASPPAGFLSMPRNREECHPRQSATSVQTTLERLKSPACLNLLLLLLMMMMMITMTETKICPAPTAHPELMSFP